MRKILKVVGLLLVAAAVYADFYEVNVTRIEQDLYRDTVSKGYIQTRFCYEHVYHGDAVLSYTPYSTDNKLIFESGTVCEVRRVFK